MKKSKILFQRPVYYFILATLLLGIVTTATGSERINIQGGISLFPDPRSGSDVYVEFPFVVHRDQFSLLPTNSPDSGLIGSIFAEIVLSDSLGPVNQTSTTIYIGARDSLDAQDSNVRIFDRLSLMIPPGVYSAKLNVIDVVGKSEGSFLYDRLEIDPLVTDRLNLSSLELAYRIRVVEQMDGRFNGRLVKNEREIVPNPMGVFSENDSTLYVYAELYNFDYDKTTADSFSLNYHIFTTKGESYFNYGTSYRIKPDSSAVITNKLNIAGFEPNRYNLQLIATDIKTGQADTASTRFIVFPRVGATEFEPVMTVKYPFDTAGLETKRHLVKYLMAPQQLAMLETLNDSGKVRFINQFFQDKDPDRTTEANEYLDDLFNRYMYANERFSTEGGKMNGWNSDRGRVLLQYDAWDERDEALAPAMGSAWELWSYHSLQGGVVFVFLDEDGYGDYKLVHSNAKGEIFDSDWDAFLKEYDPKTLKEGYVLPDLLTD